MMSLGAFSLGVAGVLALSGCSADDLLSAPPPIGQITINRITTQSGAEQFYAQAVASFEAHFADGQNHVIAQSELLTDQFRAALDATGNVDARRTAWMPDYSESQMDQSFGYLMETWQQLNLSVTVLQQFEPASDRYKIGEAYARMGYTDLLLAETYCSGVTLDRIKFGGGIEYAHPITTDSLFGVAVAHFDSALANANGNASVIGLANNGKARALLGRGKFSEAATAAHLVPTNFVYSASAAMQYPIGTGYGYDVCSSFIIGEREGGTGLDYVSAHDPRLVVKDSLCSSPYIDWTWRVFYSDQYGVPRTQVTFASGIEARLIEAEAKASAGDGSWINDINALRTTCTDASACASNAPAGAGGVAGLPPLSPPSTPDSAMAMIFRERAFWLFGQGSRLGDMRRLVKYHNRSSATVYPVGPYPYTHTGPGFAPLTTYGTDISLTLPTKDAVVAKQITITNPYFQGCLGSPASD